MKMILGIFIVLVVLLLVLGTLPRMVTRLHAGSRLFEPENTPTEKVAIVFGAGLYRNGSPTPVLRDRVATAVELYQGGKVEKLLMSGDNSSRGHNEPIAMRDYAISLGIPEQDIILDYAGHRTYDTCYRARDIFLLDDVILVTQKFHLSRALYTCKNLDLETVGVAADLRTYRAEGYWNIREIPACMMAFFQVHITKPEPVLGDQEPIFPVE